MGKSRKMSLRETISQEMEQIEREIGERSELENIRVTKEMDEALLAKIQEYEKTQVKDADAEISEEPVLEIPVSEEAISKKLTWETKVTGDAGPDKKDQKTDQSKAGSRNNPVSTGRDGVKVKYKKKRIRWIVAFAAVLVLVLGLGMTSVGSKSYLKELLDVFMGDGSESARIIDVEDMEKQESEDIDELAVFQEIGEKFGLRPVWMRYKPEYMRLAEYEIDENLRIARMIFDYQGTSVRYTIYASLDDSSWTAAENDEIVEEYIMKVDRTEITVQNIRKPDQTEIRRMAKFEYAGIHYELKGVMEKEEFEEILRNLYFL